MCKYMQIHRSKLALDRVDNIQRPNRDPFPAPDVVGANLQRVSDSARGHAGTASAMLQSSKYLKMDKATQGCC